MKLKFIAYGNPNFEEESRLIDEWWGKREGIEGPGKILPNHGYIAWDHKRPIAALFLYRIEGSPVAMVAWPIANPATQKKQRNFALNLLFDRLHFDAKELGYKAVMTTTGLNHVARRLEHFGYKKGDVGITQYWKGL